MDACRLGVCAHMTERGRERRQRGTSLFSSLERNSHRPIILAVPVISIGESPQDHEMQCILWTLGEIPRPPSASAADKHEVTWWMKTWQRAQKEELCKTTSVSSCTPAPHCLGHLPVATAGCAMRRGSHRAQRGWVWVWGPTGVIYMVTNI